MADTTARFEFPLLAAGQAQKELTHNEALTLIDALTCPVVEAVLATPPSSPVPGEGWIVGASPTGAWAGHGGSLAFWTDGGWRFVTPREGVTVWLRIAGTHARRTATAWEQGIVRAEEVRIGGTKVLGPQLTAVSDPSGGAVVDSESRAAIAAILDRLRTHGIIAV
jgi:hypothetical protein